MTTTSIEWATHVWNPVVGCTRVSEGCRHCYAERMAYRLQAMGTRGYDGVVDENRRWTGKVNLVESALDAPMHWCKPRRVFVNSMSDLFHEAVPMYVIDRVFAVMALCPQHVFMVLTKRPERADQWGRRFINCWEFWDVILDLHRHELEPIERAHGDECDQQPRWKQIVQMAEDASGADWPLPNVIIGTSCEDQATADARIPHLLRCPAACRMASLEPLLGPVDLRHLQPVESDCLDWVIVGGESGPGARPCNVDWIRNVVRQCDEAGVPVFVKQLGANVTGRDRFPAMPDGHQRHPKGGEPAEWPEDLRRRDFPNMNQEAQR